MQEIQGIVMYDKIQNQVEIQNGGRSNKSQKEEEFANAPFLFSRKDCFCGSKTLYRSYLILLGPTPQKAETREW